MMKPSEKPGERTGTKRGKVARSGSFSSTAPAPSICLGTPSIGLGAPSNTSSAPEPSGSFGLAPARPNFHWG